MKSILINVLLLFYLSFTALSAQNYSLHFDGDEDCIDLGDVLNDVGLPFTICAWINFNIHDHVMIIFHTDYPNPIPQTPDYFGFNFALSRFASDGVTYLDSCVLVVSYSDGGGHTYGDRCSIHGETFLKSNQWIHVACVVRDATDMELYINGTQIEGTYSGSGGEVVHNSWNAWIGSNFSGYLDEIWVYQRALSAAEIQSRVTINQSPSLETDLVGCWLFNEGEGDTVFDGSENEYHGIIKGATWSEHTPTLPASDNLLAYYPFDGDASDLSGNHNHGTVYGASLTEDRFGKANGAYCFDGIDDYIDIGNSTSLKPYLPVTITAWISNDPIEPWLYHTIFNNNRGDVNYYGIWLSVSTHRDNLQIAFGDGGPMGAESRRVKIGDFSVNSTEWYHIAGVIISATEMYLYINGEEIPGQYLGFGDDLMYDNNVGMIGQFDSNQLGPALFFKGKMDELRFYGEALSEEEIRLLSSESSEPVIYVSIDSTEAVPGDTILIPVRWTNPQHQTCSSLELFLNGFQEHLDFVGVDVENSLLGTNQWMVQTNNTDTLLIIAAAGAQDISEAGILFWLKYYVPASIDIQNVPLLIHSILINNGEISITKKNGNIRLVYCDLQIGDIDQNGEVRAYDASLILKYLVHLIDLDICQKHNASVSSDQSVSALDASLILQYVTGLIDSLPYNTNSDLFKAIVSISIPDQNIQPDQIIEIPLILSGSNIMSFEIQLSYTPEDLIFQDLIWSSAASSFSKEFNGMDGTINLAGSGNSLNLENEILATLKFSVNHFYSAESYVLLNKLRWNENPYLLDVISVLLLNTTPIDHRSSELITEFILAQNYPNPFNPSTSISYFLPQPGFVSLIISDLNGKVITTLINEAQVSGTHVLHWNPQNLGSGVYFYKVKFNHLEQVKKMILIR